MADTLRLPTLLALSLWMLPILTAAAQNREEAPVLAVLDLQVTGITEREMTETVDLLVQAIRETGGFGRVLGRAEQDEILGNGNPAPRTAIDAGSAVLIGQDLKADLVLFGSMRMEDNARISKLVMVETATARVLLADETAYQRLAQLRNDCARVAGLVADRRPRKVTPPKRAFSGFVKLGQEGVSRSSSIGGGSYVYVALAAELNKVLGVDVRYAIVLFPTPFQDHLVSGRILFHVPLSSEVSITPGLGYLLSTNYRDPPEHWIGLSLCPVSSGDLGGVSIELLPFALFWRPGTRELALTFELVALGFRVFHAP